MDAFLILFMLMLIAFAALTALGIAIVIVAKMFIENIKEEMDQMRWNRK